MVVDFSTYSLRTPAHTPASLYQFHSISLKAYSPISLHRARRVIRKETLSYPARIIHNAMISKINLSILRKNSIHFQYSEGYYTSKPYSLPRSIKIKDGSQVVGHSSSTQAHLSRKQPREPRGRYEQKRIASRCVSQPRRRALHLYGWPKAK